MPELVTYSVTGAIATLTMDDGKVNSLSPQMLLEINHALDRAAADRAVVILTGRPQRFSAGFDLTVLRGGGAPAREMLIAGFKLAEKLLSFPLPVVAACNGHALAMGSFLLLGADVRIGAAGAFKIGANEVAIGLTMPFSAIELCRQRLTASHLTRAAITAEIYGPQGAVEAGFLDHVVAEDQLLPEAQKLAATLAQLHMVAHAATKLRVRASALEALHHAIEKDELEFRGRL